MITRPPSCTNEELAEFVRTSSSVFDVIRKTGRKLCGGNHTYYTKRIRLLGLDTSHFKKRGHNGGANRLAPEDIFALQGDVRVSAVRLRRALLESDVPYECTLCSNDGTHNGLPLVLQVDHEDGDWTNNKRENLRFLCPNCHTQTETYGNKNRQQPLG